MPRRNSLIRKLLPGRRAWDEWDDGGDEAQPDETAAATAQPKSRRRRVAVTLTFVTLFCAGAALSAGAGDQVRQMLENDDANQAAATADASATTTDASSAASPASAPDATAADKTAAADSSPQEQSISETPSVSSSSGSQTTLVSPASDPSAAARGAMHSAGAAAQVAQRVPSGHKPSVVRVRPHRAAARAGAGGASLAQAHRRHTRARHALHAKPRPVDLEGASGATVWLNRALPDPTPPSKRLSARFAWTLANVARMKNVDWALVLAVLRAQGHLGASPAGLRELRSVAFRLERGAHGSAWGSAFAFSGSTAFADRTAALMHYYRAVGLHALVYGLLADQKAIANRVLNDPRVSIYSAGRGDVSSGRVNVRVLAMIEYLADTFNQVTVSCLISGHRLYARPGVISAHIYGLAADISSVGGTPIAGNQQPGGITERAVRSILLVPPEMMPKQVISLLGLGGPSFPLADHWNHIHIGY
jgi:hypothetical protein